jgi:pimeloyl-ACP methyl ester carboxylesterase
MGSIETASSRDGAPIAYERGGESPPLVLVHGTTSDHSTWELVQPELQKHFTVYAMDRQGRGESGGGSAGNVRARGCAVLDSGPGCEQNEWGR